MEQNKKSDEGIDLSNALKNSKPGVNPYAGEASSSYGLGDGKLIHWVIKRSGGLIKNREQAKYVLIGFVVVMFALSIFLIFGGSAKKQEVFTPGAEAPATEVVPPAEF